jgi:hypothetical protein
MVISDSDCFGVDVKCSPKGSYVEGLALMHSIQKWAFRVWLDKEISDIMNALNQLWIYSLMGWWCKL